MSVISGVVIQFYKGRNKQWRNLWTKGLLHQWESARLGFKMSGTERGGISPQLLQGYTSILFGRLHVYAIFYFSFCCCCCCYCCFFNGTFYMSMYVYKKHNWHLSHTTSTEMKSERKAKERRREKQLTGKGEVMSVYEWMLVEANNILQNWGMFHHSCLLRNWASLIIVLERKSDLLQ